MNFKLNEAKTALIVESQDQKSNTIDTETVLVPQGAEPEAFLKLYKKWVFAPNKTMLMVQPPLTFGLLILLVLPSFLKIQEGLSGQAPHPMAKTLGMLLGGLLLGLAIIFAIKGFRLMGRIKNPFVFRMDTPEKKEAFENLSQDEADALWAARNSNENLRVETPSGGYLGGSAKTRVVALGERPEVREDYPSFPKVQIALKDFLEGEEL